MIFTETQIKDWIKRRLGYGVVNVELTDSELTDAITDTKVWWQSWVGQAKSVLLTLTGTTEYSDSLIATDVDSIVDVVFESNGESFSDMFSWAGIDMLPYVWYGGGTSDNVYSTLVQYMQYREMASQLSSSDRDWEWDRPTRKLIITPVLDAGTKVLVTYISTDVDLSYLTNSEMNIFRKYALSQAMKTLAQIRMKYADKPSANGNFAMDGDALYANAEAIESDMEEKARALSAPIQFFAA